MTSLEFHIFLTHGFKSSEASVFLKGKKSEFLSRFKDNIMRFEWLDKRAYYIQLSEPQTSPRWELVLKYVLTLKQNLT